MEVKRAQAGFQHSKQVSAAPRFVHEGEGRRAAQRSKRTRSKPAESFGFARCSSSLGSSPEHERSAMSVFKKPAGLLK
jgi:hypothetical protein